MSIEKAGNNISVRPGSTSLHIVNKQNRRLESQPPELVPPARKTGIKKPQNQIGFEVFSNYYSIILCHNSPA